LESVVTPTNGDRRNRHLAGRAVSETWLNENVKPNVPGEVRQEVIKPHRVVRP
jgi:hypothetical protein